ncbi:MAG: sporulation transcription factor Spo0A [Ruminococcus sp.]|uniref:sporulation transcription factor Spo0A n=1 Tax=Ruminococcus sp. TaxID=41978 RepID=UPI0025DB0AED|nr:sporulation transcription factor Spo0A [Ruminococcus sp.]MCR5600332.1 sporulation transcription factor Spo0A [Ruminococcus sp.]
MEKDRIKVLIGEDSASIGVRIAVKLRENDMIAITRRKDGNTILDSILNEQPDVVLVDLTLPDTDALDLIEQVKMRKEKLPAFIIVSDIDSRFIERQVMGNGASYFLSKPYNIEELPSIIKSILQIPASRRTKDKEVMVTHIIQRLGVPAHIKGYYYLRSAILSAIDDNKLMECVTKQLYPCVAKKYDTTSSRVERAIRHAIEIAWDRGDTEAISQFFGYSVDNYRGRPTNSEFIALVTDKIRLQLKTMQ